MGQAKSQFTDEELQDYQDLTYFTKKEVLYAHQKFKALAPEKVGHNKNAKLSMTKVLKYPELSANPFGERICKVFSSSQDGDCTFEDFLDMMSVFSPSAPKSVKAEHAFRIFDFDGDDMLGAADLKEVISKLTESEFTPKEEEETKRTTKSKATGEHECQDCNKVFKTSYECRIHMKVHTGERNYACDLCPKKFAKKGNLVYHRRTHTGEKPYTCNVCSKSFCRSTSLLLHQNLHTGEKNYKCTTCNQSFNRPENLKIHARIHTGEKPYMCEICSSSFRSHNSLRIHKKNVHVKEACPICHKMYGFNAIKNHIQQHKEREQGIKRFVCDHCDKRFTCYSSRKEHLRIHTGEKPYSCEVNYLPEQDFKKEQNLGVVKENGEPRKGNKKKDFCFYCQNYVLNFARHLIRNHIRESEVKKIIAVPPKSQSRKQLLDNLRRKGNFLNSSCIMKPVRTAPLTGKVTPCPNCTGFFSAKQLWRHRKFCMKTSGRQQQYLGVDNILRNEIFPRMRPDMISVTAQTDDLICTFGSRYHKSHRERHNVTSRKMRELARLLTEIRKVKPTIKSLIDALRPENFELITSAIKVVAKFGSENEPFASASMALNLGTAVKQCCQLAIDISAAESEAGLKNLIRLFDSEWRFEISSKAYTDLNIINNKITIVSLASDLNILPPSGNSGRVQEQSGKHLKRKLVQWTHEQKEACLKFFKDNIKESIPPKKYECLLLKEKHPGLFDNKDWPKIKVYIQNQYVKQKQRSNTYF